MLTLNDARDVLVSFFENHKQINTVVYSDDLDFKSIPDLDYRVAHIEPLDANTTKYQMTYSFKIVIADLENPNDKNSEQEIQNDTMQIAEDFITYFADEEFELFEVNENINIQRFSESNTDRVAGVVFNVNLLAERLRNKCAIPMKV